MSKMSQVLFFVFFALLFYSCKGQLSPEECVKKFKLARNLAYANPTRQSALDSALHLSNECMQCDNIRTSVIDFKITLLIGMKKYVEGVRFVDSLKESDFTYAYKKNIMSKNLQALNYDSKNDTTNRNLIYRQIANDIGQYIRKPNISEKEFKEACTGLFAVKENYLDANQINKDVEVLKEMCPDRKDFFDFFKK